ncbi:MAG: bifunctional folylpolyglutamate synthase/dihydrofolate synthase [Flavobacteriales bacterium]|nr:bifunctional folylpolyglutamate synthase/dihydrofolate synthase [Flavobacteriales bacterium]MBK6893492.1 bifunctional folylpolyglutamate synthase/dihydrofolate synthase [Flavobacteriales bacterium]MBK7248793.1 bifunctional folylpolyglutamate synthase/dihydrofolate synthase [Flavobacteriales bacterium]MBK9058976.1 bifunctional folylpolyglutamate synthase/dihydrofolate synthase [Flavobacteriales bacterium]MBK9599279.1 bifunctional folylpolyglutamate synthase/dihydrofolate synthase [Flavobacter
MDYSETLAYLHARLPMFTRVGKAAYKADLSNTHVLMKLTAHPERGLKCVHLAGTNGKGSTANMIASVLQEAGYRTGLHTSPHLKDFRERFRINGAMIPQEIVTAFVERYHTAFEPVEASFFEWGVALALHWFREERTDIAVIECGLGGRLDSTNVVTPEVSIITNIGWDHVDLLGDSFEKIAAEKAGIIKLGIPVVIGEAEGAVAEVFRKRAEEVGAPIHFTDQQPALPYALDLHGPHQQRNARTALAALRELQQQGWAISEEHIVAGLANVQANTGFAGRWQTIAEHPLTIVDIGHNADGLKVVADMLGRTPHEQLLIVLGTVNDKDIERMLALLPKWATYFFCKADIPRGLETWKLMELAAGHGLRGRTYPSVKEALAAARRSARERDLVLVTGSAFVVAEVF